jgi:hypothetical protein
MRASDLVVLYIAARASGGAGGGGDGGAEFAGDFTVDAAGRGGAADTGGQHTGADTAAPHSLAQVSSEVSICGERTQWRRSGWRGKILKRSWAGVKLAVRLTCSVGAAKGVDGSYTRASQRRSAGIVVLLQCCGS